MISLHDKMQAAGGRPSGFDYLRLALALSIVAWHVFVVDYGPRYAVAVWKDVQNILIPSFFALSGYLVAGSLYRSNTLVTFLGLRIVRIVPALAVEVLLSACILGPAVTTLSLPEYFTHDGFRSYFLNIIGDVHFSLPGVYQDNPIKYVNHQLWTIPYEFGCYCLLAMLSLIGLLRRRIWLLLLVFAFCGALIRETQGFLTIPKLGLVSIECFLAGIVLYSFGDKIPHDWRLFAIALLTTLALIRFRHGEFFFLPLAYITAYLGLLSPPRHKILLSGDYSYGIYLYSYPIQQFEAYINGVHRSWYYNVFLALPVVFAMAAASWWFIEKPVLSLRRHLRPDPQGTP